MSILKFLPWLTFFFLAFIGSLFSAWLLLAQANFLYSLNYELIDIEQTIAQYAPLNKNRNNFSLTTNEEHARLFGNIVDGILDGGNGLASIQYRASNHTVIDTLLTNAEIIHLNDVAKLITIIDMVGYASLTATLFVLLLLIHKKIAAPSFARIHFFGVALLIGAILLVLLIGPKNVFYAVHVWIFPADHQWFFYYEDSLMTTIMKAPDLFALIAIELIALALLIYMLLLFVLNRWVFPNSQNDNFENRIE
jgi:Protein of unknown function (DUF1461)